MDEFGVRKALRTAINKRYTFMEVIGKGSYGYVSRASCKITGRDVALKILFNEPSTEYETIKVLREI